MIYDKIVLNYYLIGILWSIWGAVVECEPKNLLTSEILWSDIISDSVFLDRIILRFFDWEDRIWDDFTQRISDVRKNFGSHSITAQNSSQNPNRVIAN